METNFSNAVIIFVVGFSSVFICLSVFSIIISALNKINVIIEDSKARKLSVQSHPSGRVVNSDIDEDIIPVITAAVISEFSEKIRIRKITFSPQSTETSWSQMSKQQKFEAHNIQKRRVAYDSKK
jgi:flagellar biosynthesis protein FlhB